MYRSRLNSKPPWRGFLPEGRCMPFRCCVLFPVLVCALTLSPRAEGQGRRVDFNRDIRPLLSDTCYKCHGPDEKERKAGLRLDTPEGVFGKSESGALPVVAGKSGESELYARIV